MAIFEVSVRECASDGLSRSTRVRAESALDAEQRGVEKIYGRRARLFQDSGLPSGFGQIIRSRRDRGGSLWVADCLTGRVRVTVESAARGAR
jgi:hypothetical protein